MRAAAALIALALTAGCSKGGGGDGAAGGDNAGDALVITGAGGNDGQGAEVVSIGPDAATADAAATPMRDRVAVIGVLNKRNGVERDVTLKPGQAVRIDGKVTVRLRACERTAPWEADRLTGAFLQMDVLRGPRQWSRVFSGWVYKEQPALNVVQHPVYDIWPKSCAMTFRESGPDTVPASSAVPSSAKKSPEAEPSPAEDAPSSASPSNAT